MRLLSVLLTWVQLCLSSQHVHTVNKFILPLNQPPRPLWASPGQDPGLGWLVPFTLPWPSAWHSGMYVGWRCVLIFYIKQYMLIVEDPDNRIALNNPTPPRPNAFSRRNHTVWHLGKMLTCFPTLASCLPPFRDESSSLISWFYLITWCHFCWTLLVKHSSAAQISGENAQTQVTVGLSLEEFCKKKGESNTEVSLKK